MPDRGCIVGNSSITTRPPDRFGPEDNREGVVCPSTAPNSDVRKFLGPQCSLSALAISRQLTGVRKLGSGHSFLNREVSERTS